MSWRRATAPPFGPDGTFSLAGGSPNFSQHSPRSLESAATTRTTFHHQYTSMADPACSNNPQQPIFRRRLEQAINVNNNNINEPGQAATSATQQIYHPSSAREREGIVRSPRRGGGYDPASKNIHPSVGVSFVTGSGALRNAHGAILAHQQQNQFHDHHHHHQTTTYNTYPYALNSLAQLPPYDYVYFHHQDNDDGIAEDRATQIGCRVGGSPPRLQQQQQQQEQQQQPYSVGIEQNVQLASVVEGAINSARLQRDQARREVATKEVEVLHLRREASDAANTALSSHRQHMMLDNALRTAEARIFQLEKALEAEAQHCELQIKRASQWQTSKEGEFQRRVESEHETAILLNEALGEKQDEVDQLKQQLVDANKRVEELTREVGDRQSQLDRLQTQVDAVTHQKSELSSFYEKTVVDARDAITNLKRKHQEEIVALQAEHSMQKIRLDEALTRATIGEEASRQALQVIHNRLHLLCSSFDSSATERDRQNQVLAGALSELKAATASALGSLTQEHQRHLQQVNLELAQDGELRTQIRRLQAALETATDERSQLQGKSEVLLRELDSARRDLDEAQSESARLRKNQEILEKHGSGCNANLSSLVRQALSKEVAEEAIESGIDEHVRQQQQQQNLTSSPSRWNHNNPLDTTLTPKRSEQQRNLIHNNNNNNNVNARNNSSPPPPAISSSPSAYGSGVDFRFFNQNQNQQQQLSVMSNVSPRVGSTAARLNIVSVRGLASRHPDLQGKQVKICALVFGPLGQQLCDVECDEAPFVDVAARGHSSGGGGSGESEQSDSNNNNNKNDAFSNRSFHFKRDGRFPVTVYLHPADPSVIVVHIWARIVASSSSSSSSLHSSPYPRKFLGCAILPVADILHRGPGTRVLRLREREPHETDTFVHNQAAKTSSGLGFISIDVTGPFAACVDAPPLQNDALNNVLEHQHVTSAAPFSSPSSSFSSTAPSNIFKHQRTIGIPPPSVPALNLFQQQQDQNQTNFFGSVSDNNNNSNAIGSALSTFTAEIWIRSIIAVSHISGGGGEKYYFCELVSKTSKIPVLTTPKKQMFMMPENNVYDTANFFWPKADSTVTLTLARNEGFLLQLFESNNSNNLQAGFASASSSLSVTPPLSGSLSRGGTNNTNNNNNNNYNNSNAQGDSSCRLRNNNLIGCADVDASFLLSEFAKATSRKFGGSQSDRKSIAVHLEQRHEVGVTTAIVELVVRLVP